MNRAFLFVASLAVAASLGVTASLAKPAKPKAAKAPVSITVENKRPNTLTALQIVLAAEKEGAKETIVASLAKPLAKGHKTSFKLKGAKGCAYSVRWQFDDQAESDEADMDLCKDGKIVLTD